VTPEDCCAANVLYYSRSATVERRHQLLWGSTAACVPSTSNCLFPTSLHRGRFR